MVIRRPAGLLSVLIFFFAALFLSSCADGSDGKEAELPEKTRELLDSHNWNFKELKASEIEDPSSIRTQSRYYLVDLPVREIWDYYLNSDPSTQWTGPMARFAGIYDPESDRFYTAGDSPIPGFAEGQIMFLDLVVEHFKHFPTAFIITEIDDEARMFEFRYLEGNAADGMQQVSFHEVDYKGRYCTLIHHQSFFDNARGLRDYLYPPYHARAIDEYHRHVSRDWGFRLKVIPERKVEKKGLIPEGQPL